jgi:hypothetical protein
VAQCPFDFYKTWVNTPEKAQEQVRAAISRDLALPAPAAADAPPPLPPRRNLRSRRDLPRSRQVESITRSHIGVSCCPVAGVPNPDMLVTQTQELNLQ